MTEVLRGAVVQPAVTRLDVEALRAARPGVEALRGRVAAALASLSAVLDAEGPCWGYDEAGHAFGDAYRPAAGEVRAAFDRAATRLADVGSAVSRVAEVLDAADGHARRRFT
jgi:hypothetical protein